MHDWAPETTGQALEVQSAAEMDEFWQQHGTRGMKYTRHHKHMSDCDRNMDGTAQLGKAASSFSTRRYSALAVDPFLNVR